MKERCTNCQKIWNISIRAKIPCSGYICPYCKTKKSPRGAGTHSAGSVKNHAIPHTQYTAANRKSQ